MHASGPSEASVSQRANHILSFRDHRDFDQELKMVEQLASGRRVDDDMGGAYLAHTYPGWTHQNFKQLVAVLKDAGTEEGLEAWMKQRLERLA